MKRLLLTLLLPGLLFGSASQSARPARKPNVILILTDDQGSVDLNCYGAADLQTPHRG